ncbi:ImmA/IrrE family metallo-endopeptidase [Mesonia sp.]|uniref:ImmA/IrrE family metallo-endopeptidase n=1 Tax=Mesonia sp. TaxID=1960830 RepID=UPI0017746690|nr:ImmA/IrrE family metallo-endopeptidase [Mesonia sp.]HIB37959.1 hypothetical protein [Mesonia sp.]
MSEAEEILNNLFKKTEPKVKDTLDELFKQRLKHLSISKTKSLSLMGMGSRTLDGILSGKQKVLDFSQLIKLSSFLGLDLKEVAALYVDKLNENYEFDTFNQNLKLADFLNENFNLAELKKIKLIDSLDDYDKIAKSICNYLGLKSIFDYKHPNLNISFSSGKRAKKNCSISNWVYQAKETCIELNNNNNFIREKLIEYIPQIRWYSMDVENGLVHVIKHLYQLGITVVMIPKFPSIHIRGATFNVNDKPCIALTDYKGYYPTIWFALVHELYHVLFDWDEIRYTDYHISQEDKDYFDKHSQNEKDANEFARKFLFSKEKTSEVSYYMKSDSFVFDYCIENHVHPSFAYVFYAFDNSKNNYAWSNANKKNPTEGLNKLKLKLENPHKNPLPFEEHIKKLRSNIYH